jgi:uncharacterized protein with HEPN domain
LAIDRGHAERVGSRLFAVDFDTVWKIIERDLTSLEQAMREILVALDEGSRDPRGL